MKRIDAVREARNALVDGQHLNSLPEMRQAICMANRLLNAVISSYDIQKEDEVKREISAMYREHRLRRHTDRLRESMRSYNTECELPQSEIKTEGK